MVPLIDHEMYVVDEYKQERIIVPALIGIDLFDKVSLFIGPNFSFKSDVFFEENNEKRSKLRRHFGLQKKRANSSLFLYNA